MTRAPELMAAGGTIALVHDDVMDPWYGVCVDSMLKVAQMTNQKGIRARSTAISNNKLYGFSIGPGLLWTSLAK
ncbi:MAG: hypothetical protein ACREXV_11915 [Polaromonas sp.]